MLKRKLRNKKFKFEFPPMDVNSLPEGVKENNFHPEVSESAPTLKDFEVQAMFKKICFKNSSVPGDLPAILKKEFAVELASPTSTIFNTITSLGYWVYNSHSKGYPAGELRGPQEYQLNCIPQ